MANTFTAEDIVKLTMDWVVDTILIPHFQQLGLNASGEWIANVNTRAEGVTGIINGRQYTEQLVWGRRPNADQSHKAKAAWAYGMSQNNERFKNWLNIRGLSEYGFQVAYKIADVGTRIYQNGGTDLLEILERPETINRINEFLANQLQTKVQLFLEREIQSV